MSINIKKYNIFMHKVSGILYSMVLVILSRQYHRTPFKLQPSHKDDFGFEYYFIFLFFYLSLSDMRCLHRVDRKNIFKKGINKSNKKN